jgi:hypothetical protein
MQHSYYKNLFNFITPDVYNELIYYMCRFFDAAIQGRELQNGYIVEMYMLSNDILKTSKIPLDVICFSEELYINVIIDCFKDLTSINKFMFNVNSNIAAYFSTKCVCCKRIIKTEKSLQLKNIDK